MRLSLIGVFLYAEIIQPSTPILAWQLRESSNEHRASRIKCVRKEEQIHKQSDWDVCSEEHILVSAKLLEFLSLLQKEKKEKSFCHFFFVCVRFFCCCCFVFSTVILLERYVDKQYSSNVRRVWIHHLSHCPETQIRSDFIHEASLPELVSEVFSFLIITCCRHPLCSSASPILFTFPLS